MAQTAESDLQLLLLQLKQGSEPAFNALYNLHSKLLLSNIRNLVKDNEIAKELLQDLYLKIWENRRDIDPEKSFKSFLFTIARNMVYDYLRRVSVDKKAKVSLLSNAIEYYTHTEENLDFKESNKIFRQAIQTLPPQRRLVYTLKKLEGKSHQEISQEMGISISTINNQMVKANKEIRLFLFRNSDLAMLFFTVLTLNKLKS